MSWGDFPKSGNRVCCNNWEFYRQKRHLVTLIVAYDLEELKTAQRKLCHPDRPYPGAEGDRGGLWHRDGSGLGTVGEGNGDNRGQKGKGRAKVSEDAGIKDGSDNSDSYREMYEDLSMYWMRVCLW